MEKIAKKETDLRICGAGLFAVINCEQKIRQNSCLQLVLFCLICCSQLLTANSSKLQI